MRDAGQDEVPAFAPRIVLCCSIRVHQTNRIASAIRERRASVRLPAAKVEYRYSYATILAMNKLPKKSSVDETGHAVQTEIANQLRPLQPAFSVISMPGALRENIDTEVVFKNACDSPSSRLPWTSPSLLL